MTQSFSTTPRGPFATRRYNRRSRIDNQTDQSMTTTTPKHADAFRQLAERDERVFPSYPQVARYFPGSSIEDARHRLARAIERGNGPGLVVGGPGTGKSLLLQVLASQFHEQFD